MDKKSMVIGSVVIGAMVVVGGMVWSAEKDKYKGEDTKQVVAMATAAKITIDQAIKTALENFPGKVIEAELEQKHDKTVWEVEVLTAEQVIKVVHVDAESGSVVTTEEKAAGKK
ncbi:MAG TPA: PepSY domain-containing protein [Nitrospira sp.]|nr:PepSY domain-containing protein [Nitrospira sp.]